MMSFGSRESAEESGVSGRRTLMYFGGYWSMTNLPGIALLMAAWRTCTSSRGSRMRLCWTADVPLNKPLPGFQLSRQKQGAPGRKKEVRAGCVR